MSINDSDISKEEQEDEVFVQARIPKDVHKSLAALAGSRHMPMNYIIMALLEWGARKDAVTLYRLGVHIPVFPGEIKPSE